MYYKGFQGTVEWSNIDHCYYGKIINIKDLVLYEADNIDNLIESFQNSVENYIEFTGN